MWGVTNYTSCDALPFAAHVQLFELMKSVTDVYLPLQQPPPQSPKPQLQTEHSKPQTRNMINPPTHTSLRRSLPCKLTRLDHSSVPNTALPRCSPLPLPLHTTRMQLQRRQQRHSPSRACTPSCTQPRGDAAQTLASTAAEQWCGPDPLLCRKAAERCHSGSVLLADKQSTPPPCPCCSMCRSAHCPYLLPAAALA